MQEFTCTPDKFIRYSCNLQYKIVKVYIYFLLTTFDIYTTCTHVQWLSRLATSSSTRETHSNYVYTCTMGMIYTLNSKSTCTHVQCSKFVKQINQTRSLRHIVKEA